jgi:aryl-alcohol dehydrogenase-like predicted oxidoreductase
VRKPGGETQRPPRSRSGVNFIDTAEAYGDSEEVVGKALKHRRHNMVLVTKVSRPLGDDPNHRVAERRGLERLHTEQPPYSILNRGIERELLPTAQRDGMGILVWGPLGQGCSPPRPQRPADRRRPRPLPQRLQRRTPAPEPDIVAFHAFPNSH